MECLIGNRFNRSIIGGVVAVFDGSSVSLNRSDLSMNRASLGGAIAAQYKSTVTLESCDLYQNRGTYYVLYVQIAMKINIFLFYSGCIWRSHVHVSGFSSRDI